MTSLIKNAKDFDLTYSVSSLTRNDIASNVLKDDYTYFISADSPAGQWWQISFSRPVAISSYKIVESFDETSYLPREWFISTSFDNSTWNLIEIDKFYSNGNLRPEYGFPFPINCKHFRITLRQNSGNNNYLDFSFFDCFGTLGKNEARKNNCCCKGESRSNGIYFRALFNSILVSI